MVHSGEANHLWQLQTSAIHRRQVTPSDLPAMNLAERRTAWFQTNMEKCTFQCEESGCEQCCAKPSEGCGCAGERPLRCRKHLHLSVAEAQVLAKAEEPDAIHTLTWVGTQ